MLSPRADCESKRGRGKQAVDALPMGFAHTGRVCRAELRRLAKSSTPSCSLIWEHSLSRLRQFYVDLGGEIRWLRSVHGSCAQCFSAKVLCSFGISLTDGLNSVTEWRLDTK